MESYRFQLSSAEAGTVIRRGTGSGRRTEGRGGVRSGLITARYVKWVRAGERSKPGGRLRRAVFSVFSVSFGVY